MDLKIDKNASGRTSRDLVYKTIKSNILELHLEPGSAINETDIAAALNVSRTPIREAFVRLSRENLIVSYSQRGSFVTKLDMQLVEEGRFMRKILEKAVYKNVAQSAGPMLIQTLRKSVGIQEAVVQALSDYASEFMLLDNHFHQSIFEADGKRNVWNSILDINTHFNRLRFLELKEQSNIYKVLFQHEALVNAIEAHNVNAIDQIINEHTSNVMNIVDTMRINHPGYFLDD